MILDEEYWPDKPVDALLVDLIKGSNPRYETISDVLQASGGIHHTSGSARVGNITNPARWAVHPQPDGSTVMIHNGKSQTLTHQEVVKLQEELLDAVREKRSIRGAAFS